MMNCCILGHFDCVFTVCKNTHLAVSKLQRVKDIVVLLQFVLLKLLEKLV